MTNNPLPRTGDIFTFKVNKLCYVLQYIHVVEEPEHAHPPFRFRCHVVVFEDGYPSAPQRPNLTRVYRIKSRPRGQLLYVMLTGLKPFLPRGLRRWGNAEPTGPWTPAIELSRQMPVKARELDGVTITPTVAHFPYVLGRIADDQRRETGAALNPLIFKQWIAAVDGPVILRAEALIMSLRDKIAQGKSAKRSLAACVRATNRLDAEHGFIGTIEAEDLLELLIEEAVKGGLESAEAADIVDSLRDW